MTIHFGNTFIFYNTDSKTDVQKQVELFINPLISSPIIDLT